MEYINSSLGIPVKGKFHDLVSRGFSNASGGSITSGRGKKSFTKLVPAVAIAQYIGDAKKRAKEAMGSASNPEKAKMEHYLKDIVAPKYPFSKEMSSEQLESIVSALTKDYNYENSRLPELVNRVASNNKKFSAEPNRSTIQTIQDVRAMMQVLNDYRADVIRAYEKAYEREIKQQENTAPASAGPAPITNPPAKGGVEEKVGTGLSEAVDKTMNIGKQEVSVAGKKVSVKTLALAAAGVGIAFFIYRKFIA